MRKFVRVLAVLLLTGFATQAFAITMSIEEEFAVGATIIDAEGVAVIYEGPNAGIYVPHRTATSSRVTVLDVDTGEFLYTFNTTIPLNVGFTANRGLRAIDVLPNGNLIIGQHSTNLVREVIIPERPSDPNVIPDATLGAISFTVPTHTNPDPDLGATPFAEFESISAFENPDTDQLYLLIGEEGRDNLSGDEVAGEVYLGTVGGTTLSSFEFLFQIDEFDDGFDDISGLDVIDIVFDGAGNIDRAASRILMTDDSSADPLGVPQEPQSTMYVLNLLGQILETLDGPGQGVENGFEETFDRDQWIDAEGVDYSETANGPRITVFFSNNGGNQTPSLVRFDGIDFEAPPAPEPATFALVALGLAGLALRRARRS
jgi:hypothetical protein